MTGTDEPKLLSILSDQPADRDRLNFGPYATTLADILADPGTDTPLTIGVFGGWGRGKTSLMRMVERRLLETTRSDFFVQPVWFNAWLYSRQHALWRALISRVLERVRAFPKLDQRALDDLRRLETRLYPPTESTGGHLTLATGILPGLDSASLPALTCLELLRCQAERQGETTDRLEEFIADVETSQALARRDQIAALDDFRRQFEDLSRRYIINRGRLAIFVDDLDRCLPDKAIEVLEAVKLFLDVPGCVFVLGVAREIIEEGIRVRYADYATHLDGAQYLEKIIQIPFSLPPIQPASVANYIHEVTAGNLPDPRCGTVFSVGLEPNPRRIKRTLNIFLLLWRLAQNREDLQETIKPVRLSKIVIIQQYHPRLFALLTQGPHFLIDLERRFRAGEELQEERGLSDQPRGGVVRAVRTPEQAEEISAGPLTEFLNRALLRDLLTCTAPDEPDANFIDLTPAGVAEYVYLTRSTVEEKAVEAEAARLPFEPQMVTVPQGPFLMGTPESELDEISKLGVDRDWIQNEVPQHEVNLPAYAISRYPVTNAEFARFVEGDGYTNPDYWTDAGWKQREEDGWTQPRYWEDEKWDDPAQPVVGVSWYEAVAYCRWLTEKSGRDYRLPTEAQWEKAARGTDGRRYPWDNDWDPSRCNNKESGPGRTTPVGQYPDGDSPYGVGDLVGQVWEWCSSKYGGTDAKPRFGYPYTPDEEREDLEGDDTRILRGGSWYDDSPAGICRCGYRNWRFPWYWHYYRGFRCVRISPS
jgi:formylglycine-generating enzyme required for sulfatase activity